MLSLGAGGGVVGRYTYQMSGRMTDLKQLEQQLRGVVAQARCVLYLARLP